jgi:GAF domain-containing protein
MSKNSISKRIDSKSDIFQPIAESIHRVTSLPVSIWAPDKERKNLQIVASVGLPEDYIRTARLDLNKPSVTGDAFKSRKNQKVMDISTNPRWKYKKRAKEMNWQSAICVPITSDGIVIGVVSVYAYTKHAILEAEQILPDFVKQISLTQEIAKQTEIRQHMLDIGLKLQSVTEHPKSALYEIVKGACELIGASCAVIYPYDVEHGEFQDIKQVVSYGLRGTAAIPKKPRTHGGMAADIIRRGEIFITNVKKQNLPELGTSTFIKNEEIQAFMGISLKTGKATLGVLYVNFRVPHAFTQQEKDTIRLFAHQASSALNNSRLYQQAKRQTEAMKKLQEIGVDLMSLTGTSGSLRSILEKIAQSAQEVLGADLVDLYQYNQSRDVFIAHPIQIGKVFDPSVSKHIIHKDDVVYSIVKRRKPKYTINAQADPDLKLPFRARPDAPKARFVVRENIASMASVPLMVSTEVVGVLFANFRKQQPFSPEQQSIIELFANQAAVVIRKARLFEQRNALQEIAKDVTHIYDKDELLQKILVRSLELLGCEIGSVCLLDKSTGRLEFQYAINKERYLSVPFGKGLIGSAAKELKPIRVGDVTKDARYIKHVAITRSELDVPMLIGNELIGVLNAESNRFDTFDEDAEKLAVALAGHAAIAIQNVKLLQRRQSLSEFGQAVTSGIRLQENAILDLVYKQASKLMNTENLYIALYDDVTNVVRFGLAYKEGKWIDVSKEEGWQPRKAGKGRTEEIIHTKKPIFTATRAEAVAWYQQPGHKEYVKPISSSWIGVPMIVADRVIGVIATHHLTQDFVYNQDDLEILQSMANQAAVALDNSNLYQDIQKRREQLERIRKVTNAIARELDIQTCMQIILEETMKLLGADFATIQLIDKATNELVIRAQRGMERRKLTPEMQRIKIGIGITGKAVQDGRIIRSGNVQDTKGYLGYIADTLSEMAAPLFEQNEVIGVLNIEDASLNAFDENDEELFRLLAEQVVISIQNARKAEERERLVRLEYLGILAGGVAHRLGSRGGLIRLHVNQIRELLPIKELKKTLPSKTDEMCTILDNIEKNNEYLLELSEALFKPASASETPLGSVNVNQLLQQAIRRVNKPSEVQLSVTKGKIPPIVGNKWLVEVFIELITNSIKAMKKSKIKELNVRTQLADKHHVSIFITDTGIGISKAEIDKVFNLFYTHNEDADSGKHGFGLWYCKAIVNRMGGDLKLVSELGAGTTCSILLPLAKKARLA